MPHSFTAAATGALAQQNTGTRRPVLVTGAAGRIGSYFAEHAHDKYELRLMVRETDPGREKIAPFGEVVVADLGDLDRLKEVCAGIDTVVHLAADPRPNATWQELLPANITGTYNMAVAAKSAGCRRIVFASSIHAISGYPADVQVKTIEPVNPGDLYGVSKCFGEALLRYMAEKEGLSAIAVRIGSFQDVARARQRKGVDMMDAFVSKGDLQQLLERCIDNENLKFAIVQAVSNNRFKRMDISDARELLGYDPVDDATEENPQLKELKLNERVGPHSIDDPSKSGLRNDL